METFNSEDHRGDKEYRRQTKKRMTIIGISTVVLIAVVVGGAVGMAWQQKSKSSQENENQVAGYTGTQSISIMCSAMTLNPDSCNSSVISLLLSTNYSDDQTLDTKQFLRLSMQVSMKELRNTSSIISSKSNRTFSTLVQATLGHCETLMKNAMDHVKKSITSLETGQDLSAATLNDIKRWLNAAVDEEKTCSDELKKAVNLTALNQDDVVYGFIGNSTIVTSNSLEIASYIMRMVRTNRKLLGVNGGGGAGGPWRSWEEICTRQVSHGVKVGRGRQWMLLK